MIPLPVRSGHLAEELQLIERAARAFRDRAQGIFGHMHREPRLLGQQLDQRLGPSHLGNGADEDRQYQARRVAAAQDIGVIMVSLMLYRLDNGAYPTQKQGLRALTQKPSIAPVPSNWKEGGYLQRLPNDPFGHPYKYLDPGVHGDIDVYSAGGDQLAGDESAVIGSWQPWVHKYTEAVMKQAQSSAQ